MILTFTDFGNKLGTGGAAQRGLSPNKNVQQLISVNQWVRNSFWNRSVSMTTRGTFAHINSVSANIVQQTHWSLRPDNNTELWPVALKYEQAGDRCITYNR